MSARRILLLALALCACTAGRMVVNGSADVWDNQLFAYRAMSPAPTPDPLLLAPAPMPATLLVDGVEEPFEAFLREHDTLAFLVLRAGALVFEGYWNGGGPSELTLAFSASKSVTSLLVGLAIDDGLIRSVDQPVTDFVPELAARGWGRVTLAHLLHMTSGSSYDDSDVPLWGDTPWLYWGEDMAPILLRQDSDDPPGQRFVYRSGDTQLLGLILARALAPETITAYMERRLWHPLGAEGEARWSLDHAPDGLEKTFCCRSARARDLARIGLLMQGRGAWKGRRIVSEAWIDWSTDLDQVVSDSWRYRAQWWFVTRDERDFLATGHRGQYIYVHPVRRVVIVRLGFDRGGLSHAAWRQVLHDLAERVAPEPASPAGPGAHLPASSVSASVQ